MRNRAQSRASSAFRREPHPSYRQPVPAADMIRFSINSHRGCGGGCSFCALAAHQGRTIRSRSGESLLGEAASMTRHPKFAGTISDVGGPSANMWGAYCNDDPARCQRASCLHPGVCPHFIVDQMQSLKLLQKMKTLPKVKHVRIASGVRHDLAVHAVDPTVGTDGCRVEEVALGSHFAINPVWSERAASIKRAVTLGQTPPPAVVSDKDHRSFVRRQHSDGNARPVQRELVRGLVVDTPQPQVGIQFIIADVGRAIGARRHRRQGRRQHRLGEDRRRERRLVPRGRDCRLSHRAFRMAAMVKASAGSASRWYGALSFVFPVIRKYLMPVNPRWSGTGRYGAT